jgi:adenylate kinase family enzyme
LIFQGVLAGILCLTSGKCVSHTGKGTQCAKIAHEFNYVHLSAGDLLRAEVSRDSTLGKEIEEFLKEGKIVPMVFLIFIVGDYDALA